MQEQQCTCPACVKLSKLKEICNKLGEEDKSYLINFIYEYLSLSDDNAYYLALIKGEWIDSDAIIERVRSNVPKNKLN